MRPLAEQNDDNTSTTSPAMTYHDSQGIFRKPVFNYAFGGIYIALAIWFYVYAGYPGWTFWCVFWGTLWLILGTHFATYNRGISINRREGTVESWEKTFKYRFLHHRAVLLNQVKSCDVTELGGNKMWMRYKYMVILMVSEGPAVRVSIHSTLEEATKKKEEISAFLAQGLSGNVV